ncbi:hypothetical protein EBZ80_01285 [bacterium]|nr:hypothetical protein [bacterium]
MDLQPESIYFKSLSFCAVLTTIALLFYHMTRANTLEMNPIASGVFAVMIILISVVYFIVGTLSYHHRLRHIWERQRHPRLEKQIWYTYFTCGILLILIQILISIFILVGIVQSFYKT